MNTTRRGKGNNGKGNTTATPPAAPTAATTPAAIPPPLREGRFVDEALALWLEGALTGLGDSARQRLAQLIVAPRITSTGVVPESVTT